MPIALTEYTQYHPTRLTRQSDNPVMSGTYTLEALTALYGGDNEYETLRVAAMQGQAFFKKADGFTAFNPIPGETADLPLDVNPTTETEVDAIEVDAIEAEAETEVETEVDAIEAEAIEAEAEADTDEAIEADTEADTDDTDEGNDIF